MSRYVVQHDLVLPSCRSMLLTTLVKHCRLSRLRQLNLTDCRSLEVLPDGMESLDALVWLEGCLALRRPLAMAAWSAEMYCRQLDARFGPPPDHGGGE